MNKRNLTTILIPKLDKPEYTELTRVLNEFMDEKGINSITKALPELISDYEFTKTQRDGWQEKYSKLNSESREEIRKLKNDNLLLTERLNIVELFFKTFTIKH